MALVLRGPRHQVRRAYGHCRAVKRTRCLLDGGPRKMQRQLSVKAWLLQRRQMLFGSEAYGLAV